MFFAHKVVFTVHIEKWTYMTNYKQENKESGSRFDAGARASIVYSWLDDRWPVADKVTDKREAMDLNWPITWSGVRLFRRLGGFKMLLWCRWGKPEIPRIGETKNKRKSGKTGISSRIGSLERADLSTLISPPRKHSEDNSLTESHSHQLELLIKYRDDAIHPCHGLRHRSRPSMSMYRMYLPRLAHFRIEMR